MISCKEFYEILKDNEIDFFTGVPDSLLKNICAYITDNVSSDKHIISANEGGAIALATGYHLATEKTPLIYMQNSGQGNTVNPLTSLADPEVYSIPMLLLIGWRAAPGVQDEPQHVKQGRITLDLLKTLEIPYEVLPENIADAKNSIGNAISSIKQRNAPYALVVRKGTFEKYELQNKIQTSFELNREQALKLVVSNLDSKDVIISTTGKASRELFEHRENSNEGHEKDFLTVGSMGHSSKIALGIALSRPDKQVYCFDGDGAAIMHLGALAIIGSQHSKNFKHIIFNNGAHDSVGGQPTAGFKIDFTKIAEACGYKKTLKAETSSEIKEMMDILKNTEGPTMLEIRINKGARKDLGRPTTSPIENKSEFMKNLNS